MPSNSIPERRLSQLLWRHFSWHLWVGLAIWIGFVLPIDLVTSIRETQALVHSNFYGATEPNTTPSVTDLLTTRYVWVTGYFLFFCLFPAVISALMRHPLLVYLAHRAHTRRELVWKSLIVFVLSMTLLSLIPWPIAYNQFSVSMIWNQWRVLSVLSLPWLIATGLASYKLAAALALPSKAN